MYPWLLFRRNWIDFHIRTVHLDIIKVLFIHQLMQQWVVLKNNIKIYIKTALTFFISVINQLDAQNFCFTLILFHASTCFKHMCSKHVEAWNKLIIKQKFCASGWLITEINILRCTVHKTSKALTCFGVTVTPSSGSVLICAY